MAGTLLSMLIMALLRKPVEQLFGLSSASYTSVFQGVTRWNAFIGLAIVEKLYGPPAMTLMLIGVATMIIPINIGNIAMLARYGEKEDTTPRFGKILLTHPHLYAVLAALLYNGLAPPLYAPLAASVELLSRVSLPLGLILVGAGLRLEWNNKMAAAVAASLLRLLGIPALFVMLGVLFGMQGQDLVIMAICGAVPTAMSGYVLARQMGGDAPFFAAISTVQTLFAFVLLPGVIYLAAYFN
ncbi:MAG: AEC family transporter [Thiolinea sp.]